jgi:hypothetical protein
MSGTSFATKVAWLVHSLRQVDEIGALPARQRRAGTMTDRAGWEWARNAVRLAMELAHELPKEA